LLDDFFKLPRLMLGMGRTVLCIGSRGYIRQALLSYCYTHFEAEQLWLVDSLQILEPFAFSRQDVAKTRLMLCRLKVARTFTLFQLRDKLFTFKKLPLCMDSTIIVSGLDAHSYDRVQRAEQEAVIGSIVGLLLRLQANTGCKLVIGLMGKELMGRFLEATIWAEQ
jgi:hypothetical protein